MQILAAGFLTTVQDLGRVGFERLGVPQAGAMDRFALRAANALVGNPPGAAGLECALGGCRLLAGQELLVAAGGVGFQLWVGGRAIPLWMAAYARPYEEISLVPEGTSPGWGYLAFSGGIGVPLVMGSRSTYLRGGFGGLEGRVLRPGDELPLGPGPDQNRLLAQAGRRLPLDRLPAYGQSEIEVVPGPQGSAFQAEARGTFLSAEYEISPTSDRMGYRLTGPALAHSQGADLLSEGLALGSIQVPGNGQPLVLMADRQTTGGYPKIATVASASLPVLVQCLRGRVRFKEVAPAEAQTRWRALVNGLNLL